jgi:hypothetical protein
MTTPSNPATEIERLIAARWVDADGRAFDWSSRGGALRGHQAVKDIVALLKAITTEREARQQAERERDAEADQSHERFLRLTSSEQSRETLRTALEPLARKEHDRAVHANALFSVEHWKHNAGPDWPHEPDDDSFAAFENCKHPICALAASQPAAMTTNKESK